MPVQVSRQHQSQPHHANHSTTSLTSNPNTSTYSLHRDSPTSSRDDASSTTSSISIDGRQRKRLHMNPESSNLPRNTVLREPRSPPKPTTRPGVREPKRPLVTRAPDFSSLKSDNNGRTFGPSLNTSSAFTNANARTDANESQNIHLTEGSNVTTFYAFSDNKLKGEAAGLDDPFDFQPSMNLEDVHRGIIDHEQLNSFPSPTRKVSGNSIRAGFGSRVADQGGCRDQNIPTGSAAQGGSLLRRPSVNKYSLPQNREPRDAAPRRRVSNASNLTISTPGTKYRTSIATIEPASSTRERRKPSGAVGASGSLGPPVPSKYHKPGGYSEAATEGGVKIPVSARNTKSKSLQPPPRQGQNLPLKPSLTPDHYRASVGFAPKSPRSPSTSKKIGTPGSTTNRRISTIPHASGLAARTISPTDARRLKRLSMLNTPPPPLLPSSLEPVRSTPGSPSMIPRKSVTPSSQGTTPEPQRKSYSSGLSISSTTTSARTSTSSSQPKLALNLVSSRLPRPPQLERDDDDIPPVPPLPKNLASPSEPQSGESSLAPSYDNTPVGTFKSSNSSLYGPRKSSLAPDRESVRSLDSDQALSSDSPTGRTKSSHSTVFTPRKSSLAPDTLGQPEPLEEPEIFDLENFEPIYVAPEAGGSPKPAVTTDRETRRKRGMTLGGMGLGGGAFHMLENKASASSLRKKDLAPIRLPPLNLLPLSTPTIARVNALGPASDSEELTPPPQIGNRTPGTPMTASKATFFGRRDEGVPLNHERSMSSFNHSVPTAESPSSLSLRASSRASSSIPVSASSRMGRQTISPYISSSLPRGVSRTDNEAKGTEHKKTGMQMPGTTRVKSRSRKSQDSLKNAAPSDDLTDSPSTSTSIRRKLSLSWKKSSQGKNSHAATERAEEYCKEAAAAKFDNMPPPRLPTSSTWTAPGAVSTPSPSKGLASQARRKGSVSIGQHDRTRSDSWGITQSPKKEKKVEDKPAATSKAASAASSILSPMTKMLGSKGSLSHLRGGRQPPPPHNTDPNLDQDDLIAEEEIRKIASKRRNLDQAAAQLDELKRRAGPKDRLSPQQVLRMGCLNIFEKGEIVDYKDVYFTGLADAKKHVGDLKNSSLPNFGYDDDRGDYTIIKGDHLAYRYEIVDILGKGSFGQVVRCIDHRTGGLVAIKIIRNKKRFHQQALVEVNILQKLKEWDPQQKHSLINFTQSFYFRGHLCISTELLGMNLYEFIKSNDFRGFSLKLIRRFTKQMLSSLVLLKGHRVIHCDLKPENILLAHPARTEIKVIDFGSSCFENEKVYTYIQSRFYRSPEVILGMSYGLAIDMWSLGCILAELFTGYPIFPGENEQEQLACIMEVFGPPEKHLIEKSTRRKLFFDSQGKPRMIVSSKGRRRRVSSKSLQSALKCDDEPFLDFVSRCLRWDPEKRMRPDEAMNHEFITGRKAPTPSRARSGNYASATASSDTRSARYTAYSRPLPDPPAAAGTRKPSHSPMKSTVGATGSIRGKNPTITGAANKRNSTGATSGGTSLPRVAAAAGQGQRSFSGKAAYGTEGRSSGGQRRAGTGGSNRILQSEGGGVESSSGEGRRR
ncbi:hypothetical protein K440DRAFT_636575 [Wilcoxina mikolae CBS 423.85]|nr:hypothetical protein K440DRAFT_636575 [Wilcoxina mikolae CBS 423.85]